MKSKFQLGLREAVYRARQENIMAGTSTETPLFSPKDALTRAQFATLLHKVMQENPAAAGQQIFTDVKANSWYDGYVSNAYAKGWVKGISATTFGPNQPITRQDLAVILHHALKLEPSSAVAELKDINTAKAYARSSIQAVYNNQLMKGYNGNFQPNDFVTREMAAVVAMGIYDRLYSYPQD